MLGVDGQYRLSYSVAGVSDFLVEGDFHELLLVEEAGNVLPSFQTTFWLEKKPEILERLNEGNALQLALGRDEVNVSNLDLLILKKQMSKIGASRFMVKISGLYNTPGYLNDCKIKLTSKQDGISAIKSIASSWFKVDTNISSSKDKQTWIQHNVPDKLFVNNIWLHTNVPNSFIAVGITINREFRIRDIRKLAKTQPVWKFVDKNPSDAKSIVFDGEYFVESNTALMNQWAGYDRDKPIYELESGSFKYNKREVGTILSISSSLDRTSEVGRRVWEYGMVNENVHSDYWSSYLRNMSYLAMFSTTKLPLSFTGPYNDIKVLDLVYFSDSDIDETGAAEPYSGLYLVTRVARNITNKKLVTVVELNREALGGIRGEFL
jgi:hypothetical protein